MRGAVGLLAICGGQSLPVAANAATKTASIGVSAIVIDTCSIAVSGIGIMGAARCLKETPYRMVTSTAPAHGQSLSAGADTLSALAHEAKTPSGNAPIQMTTIIF
jgi:hypothetical protein